MRSLQEIIITNHDIARDLTLDAETLLKRLYDPSYYPPDKRIALALALATKLQSLEKA